VSNMHDLPGGGVLIDAQNGWFRYDPAQAHLVPVGDAVTGGASNMHDLPGGGVLIANNNGWFRYDPAQAHLVPAGDAAAGVAFSMLDLPDGVLIGAQNGLFRYDSAHGYLVPASAATGSVTIMHDLPGGGVLIGAQNGWFRYDPVQAHLVSAGDAATGIVNIIHDLPGGGVLIGAQNGFFIAPALPLSTARVERETDLSGLPLRREVQIRVSFQHPCAPVSNHLGLTLTVSLDGEVHADVPVAIPYETPPAKDQAILSAPIEFDAPGNGTLQLRQGTTAIGMPISISISGASFWERLVSAWQIVVVIVGALYVAAFALLLLATRYTARAFTILNDAVWAKLVTWPFFLLRYIPAIQCWVLEPWFRNVRITTRRDARFVDPPVSSNEREPAVVEPARPLGRAAAPLVAGAQRHGQDQHFCRLGARLFRFTRCDDSARSRPPTRLHSGHASGTALRGRAATRCEQARDLDFGSRAPSP